VKPTPSARPAYVQTALNCLQEGQSLSKAWTADLAAYITTLEAERQIKIEYLQSMSVPAAAQAPHGLRPAHRHDPKANALEDIQGWLIGRSGNGKVSLADATEAINRAYNLSVTPMPVPSDEEVARQLQKVFWRLATGDISDANMLSEVTAILSLHRQASAPRSKLHSQQVLNSLYELPWGQMDLDSLRKFVAGIRDTLTDNSRQAAPVEPLPGGREMLQKAHATLSMARKRLENVSAMATERDWKADQETFLPRIDATLTLVADYLSAMPVDGGWRPIAEIPVELEGHKVWMWNPRNPKHPYLNWVGEGFSRLPEHCGGILYQPFIVPPAPADKGGESHG